jgi:hypothetical protein
MMPLPHVRWPTVLFFLLPITILGRTTALFSLSYYYMIPLLPFVALGLASLIRHGMPFIFQTLRPFMGQVASPLRSAAGTLRGGRGFAAALMAVAIVIPFANSLWLTIDQVDGQFKTAIDSFLIDPFDAQQAADYVNQRTQHADVVVASPGVAWLIDAHVADFQMSIAFNGEATPHLPADLPRDRFAFDPDYHRARFVVVDNLWRNWGIPNVNGVEAILTDVEEWPLVFKAGEIEVYRNPPIGSLFCRDVGFILFLVR